jgi:beta-glucosidase-like glycosyl hydrolase
MLASPYQPREALALRAAREGMVLLKNEKDLLPLGKSLKSIAVIGPNADDLRNQLGDYAPKTVLQAVSKKSHLSREKQKQSALRLVRNTSRCWIEI